MLRLKGGGSTEARTCDTTSYTVLSGLKLTICAVLFSLE